MYGIIYPFADDVLKCLDTTSMVILNLMKVKEVMRAKASYLFNKYSAPKWMVFLHDISAVFITFIFAYFLRFNLVAVNFPITTAILHGIIAVVIYSGFFLITDSYCGLIRRTTLTDISLVFAGTTYSVWALVGFSLFARIIGLGEYFIVPISVIFIHYVLITVLLFVMRVSVKLLFRFATNSLRITGKRVFIYGAGEMGFIVKRVILSDPRDGFIVAGFLDDNKQLQGKTINGVPVYNPKILLSDFSRKFNIDTLIIAIKKISPIRKSGIIQAAMDIGLEVLDTPAVNEWFNGQPDVRQFRRVKLEDLLGREPIELNLDLIGNGLNGKTILVTGAAGSIGSEIVRQLAQFNIKTAVLVDQAETPAFNLENELRGKFSNLKIRLFIADVTNYEKMELIFSKYRPDIVFHAAAYKHVPLMEMNPHEAFRVNVGGTKIVSELSARFGVEKFVMISTDKSVNPSSVMGATKRLCEMIVQSKAKEEGVVTQFVTTRFGNVLGSNGSVIPLFSKQIMVGGPVTVTHPDITRYFMTIPEACQLVLEAGFMGNGGEIYVFDMGKPVKIVDLAVQMIKLSGFVPEKDIKIVFTGLRPGEKLYEELLTNKENTIPTFNSKIKIARVEPLDYKGIMSQIDFLLTCLYTLSEQDLIGSFQQIVPEYKSSNFKLNDSPLNKPDYVQKVANN